MASGKDRVNVCVLDPIVTAWCNYRPGDTAFIDELQKRYETLHAVLADAGISFHYLGESYFKKYVSVENGKLKAGRMTYDHVILPGVTDVMDLTAGTLAEFAAEGGRIWAVGCEWEGAETVSETELADILSKDKGFETDGPCWVRTFELDGKVCRLMANTSRTETVTVTAGGAGNLRVIDTFADSETVIASGASFEIPAASFVITEETDDAPDGGKVLPFAESIEVTGAWLADPKLHLRDEKNCVTLDMCSLWVEGVGDCASGYTFDVRAVAAAQRSRRGSAAWRNEHPDADAKTADNMQYRISYTFRAETVPSKLAVAAELGEMGFVCLNGKVLTRRDGYFLDSCFECFDGTDEVRIGENTVTLCAVTGRGTPVVEDIFLLGNFSCRIEDTDVRVIGDPVLVVEDTSFPEKQGFPFFTGELCLKNTFDLPAGVRGAEIELEDVCASAVAVLVNGEAVEPLVGAPWKRDISAFARPGVNKLELRCVGTLRNLMGPIHNTTAEKRSVGPGDYNDKSRWSDEPIIRSTGFGKVKINFGKY